MCIRYADGFVITDGLRKSFVFKYNANIIETSTYLVYLITENIFVFEAYSECQSKGSLVRLFFI